MSGRELQLVDAADRARAAGEAARDRRGRMLVEAAAGTGKTTVLLSRVMATVRSGDRRLAEIAVVTFTEAAAAELKIRLRRSIRAELSTEVSDEVAGRLRTALSDLEVAAVGTIHAFALDLLKQRPIEAGVDPGFAVADEFDQRLSRARAWDLFLRRHDEAEPGLDAAYDLGLTREDELRRIAFQLAEVEPARLPAPGDRLAERWPVLWRAIGESLEASSAAAEDGGALERGVEAALAEWRELSEQSEREAQRGVLAGDFKISSKGGKAAEAEAKAARSEARALLTEADAELSHQRLAELARWLVGLGEVERRLGSQDGRLSFDQLIERTLDLLRDHPQVLEDFRRRYPILMVDEFQDTDPVQIDLLLRLAGPPDSSDEGSPPRSLFLVGDPKQSIYRFRGADLKSYRRVAEQEIPAAGRVYLEQTFRPLPELATWVNEVMERVMGKGEEPYEVDYRPLAARPAEAPPPGGGVTYLEYKLPEAGGVDEAREAEAEAFARLLHRLVEGGTGFVRGEGGVVRPAQYGDIALLLPKMTILERYERVFHRVGIPFRVVGGRHYYRRDEVHALIGVLRALADPGDPVATVAALRGPAFGISDSDLLAFSLCRPQPRFDTAGPPARVETSPAPERATRAREALDALASLGAEVGRRALPELVAQVLEQTGLLAFFALGDRSEQRIANLRKVVRVARRVEAGGADSLSAFIRWLESLLEDEPEESDSPYLEGAGAAVQLMTIHKAKGLEFPIVFLGGLVSGRSRGGDRLRIRDDPRGGLTLALSSRRGTKGHEEAEKRAQLEEAAEVKRLLYVAVTRSRDQLVLPVPGSGSSDDKVEKSFGPLFAQLYAEGVGLPNDVVSAHRCLAASDLPALPRRRRTARIQPRAIAEAEGERALAMRAEALTPVPRATFTLRPSGTEAAEEAPDRGLGEERRSALALGTVTHEVLAAVMNGRLEPQRVEEPAVAGEALPFGMPTTPKVLAQAGALASTFLDSSLGRRATGAAERCVEQSICIAGAGGKVLDGQIDLAWREPEGWVVLDYKTDRLSAGEEEARSEGYRGQLALYAEALRRTTGDPVAAVHLFFLVTGGNVTWEGEVLEGMLEAASTELDAAD